MDQNLTRTATTGGVDGTPPTVLLLVEGTGNRRVLHERLENEHAVVTELDDADDGEFDLCLVDGQSFERHRDELAAAKSDAEPAFLPVLLLTSGGPVDRLPDDVWSLVDDVVSAPVSTAELDARIETLLERRSLSRELARRKARSDQRFQALFHSTPDPSVVVTSDGRITDVNGAFLRTFGVDETAVTGRSVTSLGFSPEATIEQVLVELEDTDEESPSAATVEWTCDDGRTLEVELNANEVTTASGTTERIGIFRDVTRRAERKRELERQNERLEEFAGTIAHDLRNPLGVAQGTLELAMETGDDEHFEEVEQAHRRMKQLIDEVLTLAREGQVVLEPDSVSLEWVAESAWNHVDTGDATLEFGGDAVVTADEGRLTELFENLFRNAVEHNDHAVTIRVGVLPDRPGFFVADDGSGIPAEERDKVFDAGYTNAEDGTGFGLAIVQQIVEGHGWEVSICEGEMGGVRFEVTAVDLKRPDGGVP